MCFPDDDDDDLYIIGAFCPSVSKVIISVFSHFYTLLGLEIREKVSINRRNDKKCLEMGVNIFSHF